MGFPDPLFGEDLADSRDLAGIDIEGFGHFGIEVRAVLVLIVDEFPQHGLVLQG